MVYFEIIVVIMVVSNVIFTLYRRYKGKKW